MAIGLVEDPRVLRMKSVALSKSPSGLLPRIFLLLLLCAMAAAQSQPAAKASHGAPRAAQAEAAFDHFYNMDYERAEQDFEKIVEKHPNDPLAVNHLLTAVLMHDLYE